MRRVGHCIRFASELDLERLRSERRERSQAIHTSERDVLAAVLEFLKRHPRVAWIARANTGSGYLLRADQYHRLVASGAIKSGDARFMQFGFKGAADLTGMLRGGRRLEVECKSDRGQPTDEQQAFGDAMNVGGGLWTCVRSLDDVAAALDGA